MFKSPNQIGFKSESLSSALYFASNKDAAFTDTAITIDIGGIPLTFQSGNRES